MNLSGTITAVIALGPNFESVVKDSQGQTCQLVTPTNPGNVGASVWVTGYVAYVSPGTPPINRIATATYAANDH